MPRELPEDSNSMNSEDSNGKSDVVGYCYQVTVNETL